MGKTAKNAAKSWKTTLFGLLTIAAAVAPVWAPPEIAAKIQTTAAVLAGGGLIASKDGDVTGAN